jgi:hypothetical protein
MKFLGRKQCTGTQPTGRPVYIDLPNLNAYGLKVVPVLGGPDSAVYPLNVTFNGDHANAHHIRNQNVFRPGVLMTNARIEVDAPVSPRAQYDIWAEVSPQKNVEQDGPTDAAGVPLSRGGPLVIINALDTANQDDLLTFWSMFWVGETNPYEYAMNMLGQSYDLTSDSISVPMGNSDTAMDLRQLGNFSNAALYFDLFRADNQGPPCTLEVFLDVLPQSYGCLPTVPIPCGARNNFGQVGTNPWDGTPGMISVSSNTPLAVTNYSRQQAAPIRFLRPRFRFTNLPGDFTALSAWQLAFNDPTVARLRVRFEVW